MVTSNVRQQPANAKPDHATDHRRWFVLAVGLTGTFLVIGGVSIVNLAVPSMQRSLHTPASQIGIVIAAYSLVYAVFLITGGRLGDLLGRKRVLMLGLALFTVAVLVGGLAPTVGVLIGARVAQGIGAALIYPQILSIIEETFEGQERSFALGAFGATIGSALVCGQLLGGAIIQLNVAGLGWRAAMFALVPLGLAALIACRVFMSDTAPDGSAHMDHGGTVLLAAGLTMLILPLLSGRDAGWPWWMLAMLALSLPVLALFVGLESRIERRGRTPLLRLSLFRQRAFVIGMTIGLVFFIGTLGFALYTSVTLQAGAGFSPLNSGLAFAPLGVAFFVASLLAPKLVPRLGRYVLSIGYLLLGLGMIAVVVTVRTVGTDLGVWTLTPAMLLVGAGQGFGMSPLIGSVLSGIRHEDAGSAAGALTTAFQVGQSLGIAVVGMIFFAALGVPPADLTHYLGAFQAVALVLAGLAIVLFCLVFLLPRPEGTGRSNVFLHRPQSWLAGLVHSAYFVTGGHGSPPLIRRVLQHHFAERGD